MRWWGLLCCLLFFGSTEAHPQGSMLYHNGVLYYTGISSSFSDHHAAIFRYVNGSAEEWLASEEYASDFYLSSHSGDTLLIIETYENQGKREFRLLAVDAENNVHEKWPWQSIDWNIGTQGFYMRCGKLITIRYPSLIAVTSDGAHSEIHTAPLDQVVKLRRKDHCILLMGEDECVLWDDEKDVILMTWKGTSKTDSPDPPLGREMNFDVDCSGDTLFVTHWGARAVHAYHNGNEVVLASADSPYTYSLLSCSGPKLFVLKFKVDVPPGFELIGIPLNEG